jgi:Animal haem peroxidase
VLGSGRTQVDDPAMTKEAWNDSKRSKRASGFSRRRFLSGASAGAAAGAALGPGTALAAPHWDPADIAAAITPADRFGRIFADLPTFQPPSDRLRAALMDIGKPGGILDARDNLAAGPVALVADPNLSLNNPNNDNHGAGVTFLGQFLDHDMTFDTTSPLGTPTAPESSPNARTPSLDLDTVYGGGPTNSPQLYDPDRIKLRIENGGLFEDVPRQSDGTAIIGDPRNDENAMISGMHAAFILFHNQVVDRLRASGTPQNQLFAAAQRTVRWHYQWIIVHEFLPLTIGQSLTNDILNNGRRWYRPEPGPAFIPVEFQGAAYRFGHSQVRPSYRLNLQGDVGGNPDTGAPAFFGMIFDPAGEFEDDPSDLRGGARAPRRFVGWQTFFRFNDVDIRPNKRIDTKISTPLFRLPLAAIPSRDAPVSLPQRNLLRHFTWSIPAGQLIAQRMGNPQLLIQELAGYGVALENHTPLWYYVLAEAQRLAGGLTLGPTGGRIVGEVFIGVLQLDPTSYLVANPQFRPTLPTQTPGDFRMTDLLRFARVDPASRGQ